MRQIVLISGRLCTGRTRLAKRLQGDAGYSRIKTSDVLTRFARERNLPTDRISLQNLGDRLDSETNGEWISNVVQDRCRKIGKLTAVVVDSIYSNRQIEPFRKNPDWKISHVHLWAPKKTLVERFKGHTKYATEGLSLDQADFLKSQHNIDFLRADADVRINTNDTDSGDTFVRVAAFLGHFAPPEYRCVDVIVGGQYGSEGKGHVSGYLAQEYDVLVRVGGPNAGHTVSSRNGVFTYHHLPSGCRDTDAEILIGPGAVINVTKLLKEIADSGINENRLFIDPQAMTIEYRDLFAEREIKRKIGSTAQGVGAASARKITNRWPQGVRLAKNRPELRKFVGRNPPYRGSTMDRLELAYREGKSVLLEGTQGSGLSIHHGLYPYVTSRDTNVAGCLAEAGISATRVRRVLLVIRSFPIRVGNPKGKGTTSGFIKNETTFEKIAKTAGLDPVEVEKAEFTSTTNRKRRVGHFDWELFRKACALNTPTDIVLTFADYLTVQNRKARRFEQLNEDTIMFIEELERVAHAPVSLINTRFPRDNKELDRRSVIDRRDWETKRTS